MKYFSFTISIKPFFRISSAIPTQDEAAEKQKKSGKKKSKKETAGAEDDLPF